MERVVKQVLKPSQSTPNVVVKHISGNPIRWIEYLYIKCTDKLRERLSGLPSANDDAIRAAVS